MIAFLSNEGQLAVAYNSPVIMSRVNAARAVVRRLDLRGAVRRSASRCCVNCGLIIGWSTARLPCRPPIRHWQCLNNDWHTYITSTCCSGRWARTVEFLWDPAAGGQSTVRAGGSRRPRCYNTTDQSAGATLASSLPPACARSLGRSVVAAAAAVCAVAGRSGPRRVPPRLRVCVCVCPDPVTWHCLPVPAGLPGTALPVSRSAEQSAFVCQSACSECSVGPCVALCRWVCSTLAQSLSLVSVGWSTDSRYCCLHSRPTLSSSFRQRIAIG